MNIERSMLSATRHFHDEVTKLFLRIAPSSMSFTCIGIENVRAYSYVRRAAEPGGDLLCIRRWTSQLADVLPLERQRPPRPQAQVLHPSELGPLFEPSDPGGRVLVVVLASGGMVQGIAGLERLSTEPEFAGWQIDEVGALAGALSLAASHALAVELQAYEAAVAHAGSGRSSLVLLADHDAHQIIWARSPDKPLDWNRDVLPLQRHLFERTAEGSAAFLMASMTSTELHDSDSGGARYRVIRVPARENALLSQREHEVAQLLIGGYSNLNIAAHLGISENTIRTYIRRLYKKLNVCNRIDLIRAYEAAS